MEEMLAAMERMRDQQEKIPGERKVAFEKRRMTRTRAARLMMKGSRETGEVLGSQAEIERMLVELLTTALLRRRKEDDRKKVKTKTKRKDVGGEIVSGEGVGRAALIRSGEKRKRNVEAESLLFAKKRRIEVRELRREEEEAVVIVLAGGEDGCMTRVEKEEERRMRGQARMSLLKEEGQGEELIEETIQEETVVAVRVGREIKRGEEEEQDLRNHVVVLVRMRGRTIDKEEEAKEEEEKPPRLQEVLVRIKQLLRQERKADAVIIVVRKTEREEEESKARRVDHRLRGKVEVVIFVVVLLL